MGSTKKLCILPACFKLFYRELNLLEKNAVIFYSVQNYNRGIQHYGNLVRQFGERICFEENHQMSPSVDLITWSLTCEPQKVTITG